MEAKGMIKFDFIGMLLNPFVLMFVTIAIGLLFGKIKFGKFSFGTSGALFVGLAVGWAIYGYAMKIYNSGDETAAGLKAAKQIVEGNGGRLINTYFFSISLIIFVAAVGLLAAKDMGIVLKKYGAKFVVLGLLITFVGAGGSYAATLVVKGTNPYAVSGVYTGAMTSSPGLASALETAEQRATEMAANFSSLNEREKQVVLDVLQLDADYSGKTIENTSSLTPEEQQAFVNQAASQVGIGSAVAYPFGVIIVILAVNFLNVIFKFDVGEEMKKHRLEMEAARSNSTVRTVPTTEFSIISFAIVCAFGYLLGNVRIFMGPLGYVSLESTGGVLIGSLLLGYIGKIDPVSFRMDPKVLAVLREVGLSAFLAIVGLNYGYGAIDAVLSSGAVLAIESLAVGTVSIMAGFLVGRYLFNINWIMLSGAICGGMTSTPGLGAATDAVGSDDPGAGYGATYPFALFGMVIFTIILQKLPIL